MIKPSKVLIIGGGGYVGVELQRMLAESNYKIRVLDTFWYPDGKWDVSDGDFVDSTGALSNSILDTYQKNAKSNIHINVTNKFLTPSELVAWLNNNDINLYWYNTPNVPGVSGSIDRALAAKKPFGVNSSSFFSHVRRDFNDINKVSIKTIIENGIEPFNQFYDMWSSENLIKFYESIIESC